MSSGNSLVELQRTQIWPEIRWAFQECQNSHGCFSHLLLSFSAGAAIRSLPPSDNGCVPTVSKTWPMCFRHLRTAAETKRLNFNSPKCLKRTWRKQQQQQQKKSLDLSSGRRKLMNLVACFACLSRRMRSFAGISYSALSCLEQTHFYSRTSVSSSVMKRSEYTTSKVFFWVCGFYYLM